jgi:hypothetical protein
MSGSDGSELGSKYIRIRKKNARLTMGMRDLNEQEN